MLNLAFLGKITGKVAIYQLNKNLTGNKLRAPHQSAYTINHSTEAAIVKVSNNALQALDNSQCVSIVLADLSATFDTINHNMFLFFLREGCGIMGSVADWMNFTGRCQSLDINGASSGKTSLDYDYLQGSSLGPFVFAAH